MEILLLLLGIIAFIAWKSQDQNEPASRATKLHGKQVQIDKIDYLLQQVDLWEIEQIIDAGTAVQLRQKYQLQKQKLLAINQDFVMKPDNDPYRTPVEETKGHSTGATQESEQASGHVREQVSKPLFPPRPPKPPKPSFDLMNFLREKNIKWFNALGTLMLLASGIIFVATSWNSWNGGLKSLTIVCITLLFYLGGFYLKKKLDLANSGFAFYLVGSLFVPLDFVAFNNFAMFGQTFNWHSYLAVTALVAGLLYSYLAWRLNSQVFTGLAASMGGASLFALLSYLGVSYSGHGIYFILLSLAYFLLYYCLHRNYPAYHTVIVPLPIAANLLSALGLGLSAIDHLSFTLLTTAIVASVTYLSATYLFKRLEYLYVFIGTLVLSVFPGVDYYHLPGNAYHLSFLAITGVSLGFCYLNRRLKNKVLEQNFFYAMLGMSALTGFFILFGQIGIFNTDLYHHPQVGSAALTMLGGTVIFLISAYLYQKQRFTYVAILALITGYTLGLMWLGTSGKLYSFCYLLLAIGLLVVSKISGRQPLWSQPAYWCGLGLNGLVTLLLTVLLVNHPEVLARHNLNLLMAALALMLNSAVNYYLAWEKKESLFVYLGNGVFSLAYLLLAVYLGLSWGQFSMYTTGLTMIFLAAQRVSGQKVPFATPFTLTSMITVGLPAVLDIGWLLVAFNKQHLLWQTVSLFREFNGDMAWIIATLLTVAGLSVYIANRFENRYFLFVTTGLVYLSAMLFFNWLGLGRTLTVSLLMAIVFAYLANYRVLAHHPLFGGPLLISTLAANILTTLLLTTTTSQEVLVLYLVGSLALICNCAVYLYIAFRQQNAIYTWASLVPLGFLYLKFLWQFEIDPAWLYAGLKLMLLAYFLIGVGLACYRKGWQFYWKPLLTSGYALSSVALLLAISQPKTLLLPALMATMLYGITAKFLHNYRTRFWQATLIATNISFGALIYQIDPQYTMITYVKYFICFNLLKLGLGVYFQKFEQDNVLAQSNYAGVIITSLASLLITAISGDLQSTALTWTIYGVVYFLLAWLINQSVVTYVSAAVVTMGLASTLAYIGIPDDQVGVYLAVLPCLWLLLKIELKSYPVYTTALVYIIPISTAVFLANNLSYGLDSMILGSVLAGATLLAQGKLDNVHLYYFIAPIAFIIGYEAFLYKYEITFQELYLAPISLYLIIISFYLRQWSAKLNYLSYIGILLFMLTSYANSWSGPNYLIHALILGLTCIGSILVGIAYRHKGFFFLGIIFLLGDVTTQTRSLFMSIQKWFWIGLGGTLFLTLGVLFDKKRQDRTLQLINGQVQRFSDWS